MHIRFQEKILFIAEDQEHCSKAIEWMKENAYPFVSAWYCSKFSGALRTGSKVRQPGFWTTLL